MNKLFTRWQIYEKKVRLPNINVFYQIFNNFYRTPEAFASGGKNIGFFMVGVQ